MGLFFYRLKWCILCVWCICVAVIFVCVCGQEVLWLMSLSSGGCRSGLLCDICYLQPTLRASVCPVLSTHGVSKPWAQLLKTTHTQTHKAADLQAFAQWCAKSRSCRCVWDRSALCDHAANDSEAHRFDDVIDGACGRFYTPRSHSLHLSNVPLMFISIREHLSEINPKHYTP